MFNQFTINPAYAGSRDALSSVLLYRSQWTGLEDAPKTVNVSAHSPFHRKNMALGVNFMMDELGPTKVQSVQVLTHTTLRPILVIFQWGFEVA